MASNLDWEPAVSPGGSIPTELARHLREFGPPDRDGDGHTLLRREEPVHFFIQGLASAGVGSARMLDSALTKYGTVRIVNSEE